jgi:uncharacterized alpha-E superfamily protein
MLGKTAGGIFWMFRYLERSENTARLIDAGFRMSLTRSLAGEDEWSSVLTTAGTRNAYFERHDAIDPGNVIDFMLRDRSNPSSVMAVIDGARNNARLVRTALTREVWEATNEGWFNLKKLLSLPIAQKDLPAALDTIRQHSGLVRGALHGTMLRNDIYNFARLGTFLERADSTARILDVKYYLLLPTVRHVGSSLDNVQWETILRSVSALRAFRWLNQGKIGSQGIAEFLILDRRMPRSLAFCYNKIVDNLGYLAREYDVRLPCHDTADEAHSRIAMTTIEHIFDSGLHEFLEDFIARNNALGLQIEQDFRFYG